jgi:hypothetical protein
MFLTSTREIEIVDQAPNHSLGAGKRHIGVGRERIEGKRCRYIGLRNQGSVKRHYNLSHASTSVQPSVPERYASDENGGLCRTEEQGKKPMSLLLAVEVFNMRRGFQ